MINLLLSPQIGDGKFIIKVKGEKIQVDDKLYNFEKLSNGILLKPIDKLINVKRINGELFVELINYLDESATHEELYPRWQEIEGEDLLDDNLTNVQLDWYSDDERASDELLATLIPTNEEEENAKFEIKLIEKLTEWGIV